MTVGPGEIAGQLAKEFDRMLSPRWKPLPHQVPPIDDSWQGWLLMAGRGAGKTDACANYMNEHAMGPPCLPGDIPHWMSIIAPTLGDAATSGFYGPSGLRAHNPDTKLATTAGGMVVRWPNGAEAKLFGASDPQDVERLRSGGNRCLAWLEELAAWRYLDDCFDHMTFGLRIGKNPRWIGSTTPKPRKLIKDIVTGKMKHVSISLGSTNDNPHLPEHIREKLFERYAGTSLGAQELYGRIIEADENALWTRENVEANRVLVRPEGLVRIAIGVDPSGGRGEQGIVSVGKVNGERGELPHGYILGDYSCRLKPDGWGRRVVTAAREQEADVIVVETNFGGDMAMSVIRNALDDAGVTIPVRKITASRGKRARAEPVAALSANGRLHLVGEYPELEDQMCTWTPESDESPDRMDAMVWGAWQTKLVSLLTVVSRSGYGGGSMSGLRIG